MATKRILFVTDSPYLPRGLTGANVSLHALAKRLIARRYEPIVVCTPDAEREPAPGPSGYTVLRTPDPVAAMHEIISLSAPASIVLRAPDPAERIARLAHAIEAKLHIYFQSSFFNREFPSPRKARNLRYAANSPFLARMGEAMLAAEVALVPSVIEPDHYRCTPTGDAILFVNPTAIKGVHIATAIARRMPHRRFVFAKSWPAHPNHAHYEPRLPNIEWAPTTDDMRPLFERTKLLLVPSVWEESSARTIGEAQVSGIPCVSSDRGGMRESVGPGGVALSLADPIARWCEAIERVFTDPAHFAALREGARAQAARPDYQPAAAVDRFLEFVSS